MNVWTLVAVVVALTAGIGLVGALLVAGLMRHVLGVDWPALTGHRRSP